MWMLWNFLPILWQNKANTYTYLHQSPWQHANDSLFLQYSSRHLLHTSWPFCEYTVDMCKYSYFESNCCTTQYLLRVSYSSKIFVPPYSNTLRIQCYRYVIYVGKKAEQGGLRVRNKREEGKRRFERRSQVSRVPWVPMEHGTMIQSATSETFDSHLTKCEQGMV